MSGAIEKRLRAVEVAEWQRVQALPPRQWFAEGYIRLDRLPEPERAELEGLLECLWDDRGDMAPERLTTAERSRTSALLGMIGERIP